MTQKFGVVLLPIYGFGQIVAYVYLMAHDWSHASGWKYWIWLDVYNLLRATFWPVYLLLSLYWFGGLLPPDRI